jgi:hypothetical protein
MCLIWRIFVALGSATRPDHERKEIRESIPLVTYRDKRTTALLLKSSCPILCSKTGSLKKCNFSRDDLKKLKYDGGPYA